MSSFSDDDLGQLLDGMRMRFAAIDRQLVALQDDIERFGERPQRKRGRRWPRPRLRRRRYDRRHHRRRLRVLQRRGRGRRRSPTGWSGG